MTRRARLDDLTLVGYYVGSVAVGIGTVWGDPAPTVVGALGRGPVLWVFGACYALLGSLGAAARISGRVDVEATAVRGLAIATLLHGIIGIEDGALITGVRLICAPAMMWSYAWKLEGWHVTKADVAQLGEDLRP